ncbi:hypothetical protein [Streptomyces sp. NPDC013187]|uniref:hypothetical protein n=1 Tax=Streptomyces sp. NPDC013187 TaxID=3364865 RepID=UPI0036AA5865
MKRLLASLAVGAALAGGVTAATVLPAQAGTVSCSNQGHSSSNGGNAWANGCSHSGAHDVRLYGECELSPFAVYSPYLGGSFSGGRFTTSSCTWGVDESGFQHR